MSFFKKLKSRMFKSSSKLEEGLDAIVEDGGEIEVAPEAPEPPKPPVAEPETRTAPPQDAAPDPAAVPDPTPAAEPIPAAEDPAVVQRPAETTPQSEPQVAPEPTAAPRPADVTGARPAPVAPFEESRTSPPPVARQPVPDAAEPAQPAAVPPREASPTLPPVSDPKPVPAEAPRKPGLMGRLFGGGETQPVPEVPAVPAAPARPATAPTVRRVMDDAMLESLEEVLIAADMGVDTALRVSANIAEGRMGRKVSTAEIKRILSDEIARIMEPVASPLPIYPKRPQVVLVVGVNGSGKTTTIGKLASQFRAAGKSVVIAAGDTFRAAAVEQLQVWGDRAGVPVLTAPEGSDPASLAFDAIKEAQSTGADLLMIDTAGRLQNRADLMEELAKIVRVIRKVDPTAPHNTLLVLDATTGQNALSQVETFRRLADVSGLVMTKLDGTAKGGVLVALADKFGLPIHAIGVGEQIDDLAPFDPEEFADALTGVER